MYTLKKILFAISYSVAVIVASALFTNCSKEIKWAEIPPYITYEFVTEDGYWWCDSEKDAKVIPAEEYNGSFKIVSAYIDNRGQIFDEFPDTPVTEISLINPLQEAYNTSILYEIRISDGTLPFDTRDDNADFRIFKDSTKTEWALKEFKVSKEWVDNEIVFNLHFPANQTGKDRLITLTFVGVHDNSLIYATQFYFLQKSEQVFKAKYKNRDYISKYRFDENDDIIYEDPATSDLIKSLSEKEDVETLVWDNTVYFFDEEDVKRSTPLKKLINHESAEPASSIELAHTRATLPEIFSNATANALGHAVLYDDVNFSDTYIYYNLTDSYYNEVIEANLQNRGMNDKVSSLAVGYFGNDPAITCVLTVWEDDNLNVSDQSRKKHRISFIATLDSPQMIWNNLKTIPCVGSSSSWNDRISSLSLHFGNYGINMKDY